MAQLDSSPLFFLCFPWKTFQIPTFEPDEMMDFLEKNIEHANDDDNKSFLKKKRKPSTFSNKEADGENFF